VGLLGELEQDLAAAFGLEVDADRLLASIRDLDHVVDAAATRRHESHRDQTALWVTAVARLDLDDVGAPLGKYGAGRRYEGPGCDLEDLDALQRIAHA